MIMTPKILLIEDDDSVRESLQKLLEAEHYQVHPAYDAIGALQQFKADRTDLVVLDINLGLDNGWEVFEALTKINPFVPTIVITAEWGQRERAVTLGVEGLIEKPIDVPVFLKMIRDLLAETTEAKLNRICGNEEYSHYVPRHYEPYLQRLLERYNAPLRMASGPQFTTVSKDVDAEFSQTFTPETHESNDFYENDPVDSEKTSQSRRRLQCR